MSDMSTFTGFCIAACVFMLFVNFGFMFVSSFGGFDTTIPASLNLTGNSSANYNKAFNFDYVRTFAIGITVLGLGALTMCYLTGTTNMLGVYLFGATFWAGWINLVSIFNMGSFLDNAPGQVLISMLTIGMMIMFTGAVIGMLSGSTQRT